MMKLELSNKDRLIIGSYIYGDGGMSDNIELGKLMAKLQIKLDSEGNLITYIYPKGCCTGNGIQG